VAERWTIVLGTGTHKVMAYGDSDDAPEKEKIAIRG
jgi:hypothetical protein